MSDKEPIEQGFMDDETYLALRLDKAELEVEKLKKEIEALVRDANALVKEGDFQLEKRNKAEAEVHALRDEIKKLTVALWDAIDCVLAWSAYASEYFKEKHDLAGDLARLRAVLKGK